MSFGRLATGATISADGRWLAIRTYLAAYLWPLRDGDVAAALAHPGRDVHLPLELQGEGIAFGGDRIYIDSEGQHAPVYALRDPALVPSSAEFVVRAAAGDVRGREPAVRDPLDGRRRNVVEPAPGLGRQVGARDRRDRRARGGRRVPPPAGRDG